VRVEEEGGIDVTGAIQNDDGMKVSNAWLLAKHARPCLLRARIRCLMQEHCPCQVEGPVTLRRWRQHSKDVGYSHERGQEGWVLVVTGQSKALVEFVEKGKDMIEPVVAV
jgi:hypothetical protein